MIEFLFSNPFHVIDNFLPEQEVEYLIDQIEKDVQRNEGYTHPEWNCSVNTSIERGDSVQYPTDMFKRTYEEFSRDIKLQSHGYIITDPWYNYYEYSQNQEPHTHVGDPNNITLFSCVYFLKGCEPTEIVFSNPSQHWIYHLPVKENGELYRDGPLHSYSLARYAHQPKDNQLIVFPSTLEHFVPFHKCEEPRITISFNIQLDS